MRIQLARITFLAALLAAALFAGLAPATMADSFQPCPYPPCMAPCQYPPQPEVACRPVSGGESFITSFACCCCGGGGISNEYRWLDSE